MTKKIFIVILVFMFIFSMSMSGADVKANTLNDNVNIENVQLDVDEVQPVRGKVQYTITEAPGPIEQKPIEDKVIDDKSVAAEEEEEETPIQEKPIEEKEVIKKINKRTIDPNKPMVAITYDDGPSQYTPGILDVLKENNSVATFFVLGLHVHNNDDVLNRMLQEGSQIGNHTYNHKKLTTISDEELYKQLKGTDDLIYMATGYTPTVMRPPYGATTEELNKKISKPIIKWSIDTRDWENRNTEMITNSILENVKDGDIILMHDLYNSTLEASEIVIPELVKRGFQIVTIDELFEFRKATYMAGATYYNMYKVNEK